MKKKTILVMISLLICFVWFSGARAPAQASSLPYVDTGFLGHYENLDLVVARENYKLSTFQQAIYFRAVDNRADTDVIGADILFSSGVRIVDVHTTNAAILAGDAVWGISGGPYAEDTRGIEPKKDLLSWTPNSVSLDFDFLITSGTDDIRVIIDYGDSFAPDQYFTVALHQGQWQDHTYNMGIQVGLPGDVPGSGDFPMAIYSEVPLTGPAQAQVPEPGTILLLGCGLAGIMGVRVSRRNSRG